MSFWRYTEDMSTPKEALGATIRKARKVRGLNQDDIAERLEVNVRQVGRWEKGENTPGGLTLARLVQYFRELADSPDLAALDAIVAAEVDAVIQDDAKLSDDRTKALVLLERLIDHPRNFDRWLSYGYGLLDACDDTYQ